MLQAEQIFNQIAEDLWCNRLFLPWTLQARILLDPTNTCFTNGMEVGSSTAKKCAGAFLRWKKWAVNRQGVKPIPAKPIFVALYLKERLAQVLQSRKQLMLYHGLTRCQ